MRQIALAAALQAEGAKIVPVDRQPLIDRIAPLHHSEYFPWGGELYDRIQALAAP